MKNRKTFIIELEDIKVRQPFAPIQKTFKNKKAYNRRAFKLAYAWDFLYTDSMKNNDTIKTVTILKYQGEQYTLESIVKGVCTIKHMITGNILKVNESYFIDNLFN